MMFGFLVVIIVATSLNQPLLQLVLDGQPLRIFSSILGSIIQVPYYVRPSDVSDADGGRICEVFRVSLMVQRFQT